MAHLHSVPLETCLVEIEELRAPDFVVFGALLEPFRKVVNVSGLAPFSFDAPAALEVVARGVLLVAGLFGLDFGALGIWRRWRSLVRFGMKAVFLVLGKAPSATDRCAIIPWVFRRVFDQVNFVANVARQLGP